LTDPSTRNADPEGMINVLIGLTFFVLGILQWTIGYERG
jgi:hypothetical protein